MSRLAPFSLFFCTGRFQPRTAGLPPATDGWLPINLAIGRRSAFLSERCLFVYWWQLLIGGGRFLAAVVLDPLLADLVIAEMRLIARYRRENIVLVNGFWWMSALVGRAPSVDSWGVLYVGVVACSLNDSCGSLLAAIVCSTFELIDVTVFGSCESCEHS